MTVKKTEPRVKAKALKLGKIDDTLGDAVALGGLEDLGAEPPGENERVGGSEDPEARVMRVLTRADFPDDATFALYHQAYAFKLAQKLRKASDQRGWRDLPDEHTMLREMPQHLLWLEQKYSKLLSATLRTHPLWTWLAKYPGLGGHHIAMVIAMVRNPMNFPKDGRGTGVRALWRYAGLHCDTEGRFPQARKGVQSDWKSALRTAFLQPSGIVDSVIKLRVPKYRALYDSKKVSLSVDRGVIAKPDSAPKDFVKKHRLENPRTTYGPLFPFEIHKIARIVVAKAILGDLLIEWKKAVKRMDVHGERELGAEAGDAIDDPTGAENPYAAGTASGAHA